MEFKVKEKNNIRIFDKRWKIILRKSTKKKEKNITNYSVRFVLLITTSFFFSIIVNNSMNEGMS